MHSRCSTPSGLQFTIDGETKTTPYTFQGVSAFQRILSVPATQGTSPVRTFKSWSNGGTRTQVYFTPKSGVHTLSFDVDP
jgi:hypothetical protein